MDALRVLADDLTGACDVGAELLPGPAGVVVQPAGGPPSADVAPATICVRNTQSRTLPPAEAAERVRAALGDVPVTWSGLLLKKIDTGLRGPLGAEIDAAMDALGVDEAFVLPAIPEIGRTTQHGRQMIAGIPVDRTPFALDPHHPIRDASIPAALQATGHRRAAVAELAAVRGDLAAAIADARRGGAAVIVCDAETDADLERAVRVLLLRGRPLLLVGSTGLARALRRVLGTEQPARALRSAGPAPLAGSGVLVVAGSAHPATRGQIARAVERGLFDPIVVGEDAGAAGAGAARRLRAGLATALVPPVATSTDGPTAVLAALRRAAVTALARVRPDGLVLVGGETAHHVLEGLGLPGLWLESRLCPLVVRGRLMSGAYAGLAVVTKGGSTGAPDLLASIVRQLARGAV
ncbi:MAG TPA: four-carbon acid sugar kinase family protein [Candidatus Binatia bacterium]|nr:four-carbon acid sugar kinase family protein [Candidatus Binatia bacterium]